MLPNTQKLLAEPGRFWELVLGWVCALISFVFAATLAYMIYVVGWRNPRQSNVHQLFETQTLVIFSVFLVIAVGFSVLANRLILPKKGKRRLMSPFVLRAWGVFFSAASLFVSFDAIANNRWREIPHLWHLITGSGVMAAAAFALARTWERNDRALREAERAASHTQRS